MGSENNMVAVLNRIVVAHNRLHRSEITAQEFDEYGLGQLARLAQPDAQQGASSPALREGMERDEEGEFKRDIAQKVRAHFAAATQPAGAGEGERKGDWMQVASGRPFWPFDPRPEEVYLDDIAHGLSMLCRFGGHTQRFYSVAEHSVWCSLIVPPEHALQALMHDATEAYCVDIPRPLKRGLSNYAEIEAGIWEAICRRFGLVDELHESVKRADNAMCLAEARQIMSRPEIDWSATGDAADVAVQCWSPDEAKAKFLTRFAALTGAGENGEQGA